jgi:hypothetical protein
LAKRPHFRRIFAECLSLTPPNSCDNLGLGRDPLSWVAENRNFFTFRTV